MNKSIIAKASIDIKASKTKVWAALTTPEIIKKYFFGTDVTTDWKVGHPIVYKGEWNGKTYEDKGRIIKFDPEKTLVTTHWSPLSGVPDSPENYHTVSYELSTNKYETRLTLTQDNNASEDERIHSEQNWRMVLEGLKKLLEG